MMLGIEEQNRLSLIIRHTRTAMRSIPRMSRETVLLLVVAGMVEAIKETDPEYDTQKFIEDCYDSQTGR